MDLRSQYSNPEGYPEQPIADTYTSLPARSMQGRDPATLTMTSLKHAKSSEFFKSTRVDSCPYVVTKNGVSQAIPFYPKKKADAYLPLSSQSENQYNTIYH